MIVATGAFDVRAILAGAVAMAAGNNSEHDSTIREHPDGWGAVWRDPPSSSGLSVLRDERPATERALESSIASIRTDFLAIHVRRAGSPETRGPHFTHPLERSADDWYFMHNGSQPTVHRLIGLGRSTFDSAEYFDYIVPAGARTLDEQETVARLRAIPQSGGASSGNAIAVRRDRAYVIHWRATDLWPLYFGMHQFITPTVRIIASEVIPSIAPAGQWQPLPPDSVTEFRLE
jgi:predicted glutamine amidotransferase